MIWIKKIKSYVSLNDLILQIAAYFEVSIAILANAEHIFIAKNILPSQNEKVSCNIFVELYISHLFIGAFARSLVFGLLLGERLELYVTCTSAKIIYVAH